MINREGIDFSISVSCTDESDKHAYVNMIGRRYITKTYNYSREYRTSLQKYEYFI